MTTEFDELENGFEEVKTTEEVVIENHVIDSIKKYEDLDAGIENMHKEDRIFIKKYIKENGIDNNETLNGWFKSILISGDILDKMDKVRISHLKSLNIASTDAIAGQISDLNRFKNELIEEIDFKVREALRKTRELNAEQAERFIDIKNQEKTAYENLLTSTVAITNSFNHLIQNNTNAILKEVGSSHQLTEKVAIELASKALDNNSKIFEKKMSEILKVNKKEYDSIITRFDSKKVFKTIFINATSYFVAGLGLLIAYPFIKSFF